MTEEPQASQGSGRGLVSRLPAGVQAFVRPPLDAVRRFLTRVRWLFGVRLHPRRVAATRRWLRESGRIHSGAPPRPGVLRVAVDADALWDHMTGIGWVLHRILSELADRTDLELWLYGPPSYGESIEPKVALPSGSAIRVVRCSQPDEQSLPPALASWLLRRREPRMIATSRCQVAWCPNFLEPPRFSRLTAARVLTVHDLASILHPSTLRESRRVELSEGLARQLATAAKIVTPSATVRAEIVERSLAAPADVVAVLHGPGHLIAEQLGPRELSPLPGDLRPGSFALHVGTLEPRKNVHFLVEVWERWYREESGGFVPLVLCGGDGWKVESLRSTVERGCAEGWLVRPGYVDDATLAALYVDARFSVSASIYEGFGLPLVESMAARTALLVSDIPVYREVAGAAAVYADLGEEAAQQWLSALELLSTDADHRAELVAHGTLRVGELSWRQAAEEMVGAFHAAASNPASTRFG